MLHPAGPEGEEEDDEDEEEDQAEHFGEEGEKEDEESLDTEEYNHAILELEGLKVSDLNADTQDEDKECEGEEDEEPAITHIAESVEETGKDQNEELNEAEDECPELLDLSVLNKEFKPFRYRNCSKNSVFNWNFSFGSISVNFLFACFFLQRLKQPSAHSRTQEDEVRQRGHNGQRSKLFHHSTGNNTLSL